MGLKANDRSIIATDIMAAEKSSKGKGKPITCGKGCYYCCNEQISVLLDEVDDIMEYVEARNIDIDMKKLVNQVANYNTSDKWCVFLQDQDCVLHAGGVKPLRCSAYMVTGGYQNCIDKNHKKVKRVYAKGAEKKIKQLFDNTDKKGLLHIEVYRRLMAK